MTTAKWDPDPSGKAYSEFLSKGTEEIQDHLSLVARIQVQIGRLLEQSIEELERAQRLETLTSLIAGTETRKDAPDDDAVSSFGGPGEKPGAYLEREIKALKKMQKLLGMHRHPEEKEALPATSISQGVSGDGEEQESASLRKVLIINHDPGTVRVLRYFLEKADFDVHSCSNGADGLKRACQDRPDIILLDILLPGMDGYQVLGRLKRDERTARIPVFVLSLLAQEADILKAIDGGAADYFVKPFSPQIIIAKIRRALGARNE